MSSDVNVSKRLDSKSSRKHSFEGRLQSLGGIDQELLFELTLKIPQMKDIALNLISFSSLKFIASTNCTGRTFLSTDIPSFKIKLQVFRCCRPSNFGFIAFIIDGSGALWSSGLLIVVQFTIIISSVDVNVRERFKELWIVHMIASVSWAGECNFYLRVVRKILRSLYKTKEIRILIIISYRHFLITLKLTNKVFDKIFSSKYTFLPTLNFLYPAGETLYLSTPWSLKSVFFSTSFIRGFS